MPALAERFVRIRADTSAMEREFRSAGISAGKDFVRMFKAEATAGLARMDLKVKVTPDWSGFKNPPGLPRLKLPTSTDDSGGGGGPAVPGVPRTPRQAPVKVPVELDPLVGAFQAETRKQLAALVKQVSMKIPVTPETAGVREGIADMIRTVERQLKVKIPAGPEARGFETDLRALAREVEHQVKIHLPIEPDTDSLKQIPNIRAPKLQVELDPLVARFQADVRREVSALSRGVAARIPVTPETEGLRRQVALQIAAIERTLKIKIPVDSPDAARFEAGLRNQLLSLRKGLGDALGAGPDAIKALSGGFDALTGSAANAAGSTGQLGGALSGLAGPIGTALTVGAVVLAISALPAVALIATGAIFAFGGALASLPAIGIGLGAVVGTLSLGFKGLSEHFGKTATGGGGAAKSMSGVRNATQAVTQAQRELLKASKELDRARVDEIERIDDLGRSLRGAVIDEEDATAGVAEARAKLAEARATGDPNAIGEADRAYRRSLLTLDEARDKTGDLSAEKAKADKDGVEGSDAVQTALERQRDATERVTEAQYALAEAQKSAAAGGASALRQLTKLAPAAQATVDKLKQLKPVFEDIRLSVQQALFDGVPDELQRLSDAWKQPLKDTLTSYASTINGLFMNLGASVRNPEFIANITSAAGTFRENFEKVGKVVSGPLVDAFGRLARAAKPFIDVLGDKIAGLVQHFSDWIKSADESGKLDKFMSDAAYYLDQIWSIGGNVLGLFGDLFGILADTKTQGGAKDYLAGLNTQLESLRAWLKDPENQEKIKAFIERIGEFVKKAEEISVWIVEKGLPFLTDLINKIKEVNDTVDRWKERWGKLKDVLTAPFSFGGLFDGLPSAFKSALNKVIDAWNGLKFTIPAVTFFGQQVSPSFTVDPPYVRPLAKGGVARATPGGINAKIAEGGKDEAVAPVDVLQDYIRTAVQEGNAASSAGQGGDIIIPIYLYPGAAEMDRVVISAAERNKSAIAKIANSGNKRLGYAS